MVSGRRIVSRVHGKVLDLKNGAAGIQNFFKVRRAQQDFMTGKGKK
jgi:hypothetical protein